MNQVYLFDHYLIKRQVLALTGTFRIYDPNNELVLFSKQKMFKLKEDIRVYADETRSTELLYIQARQVMDFSAAYDVIDTSTNIKVGTLRRKGFSSLLRDTWEVLDSSDTQVGILQEDSATRAMLRRLVLGSLLPLSYHILIGEAPVAYFHQRFNLFRYEMDLDFSIDGTHRFDHRMGIAAAVLLAAVEGRQRS